MGNFFIKTYDSIGNLFNKKINTIMLGLDAAGKTTILYQFKNNEVVNTIPTIGFNVEKLSVDNISITCWDVGGSDRIRVLWKDYFVNAQAVIFVVDSNDRDRIEDAEEQLNKLLNDEWLDKKPFLIFANKQDLNSYTPGEIADKLKLSEIRNRKWMIQGCSGMYGHGLSEGFEWLSKIIN